MEKILTIGIPSYNAEKTLEDCLNSLTVQEIIDDIQIIVVNDGSKDKTSEIGHRFEEKYPDSVLVVDKENGGHGSGINTTISYATGKYMKIVDADDAVDKEGFIDLVNNLKETNAELVLSPYYTVNDGTKEFISYFRNQETLSKKEITVDEGFKNVRIAMHAMTYRTDVLKNSPYRIDEHCFYVDVEYSIYYLIYIKNILLLDKPVYCYSIGDENQSINLKNMQKRIDQHTHVCKQMIRFFEKEKKDIANPVLLETIEENIVNMILIMEYRVIFSLPDRQDSKEKLLDMEGFLKNNSPQLYNKLIELGKARKFKSIYFLSFLRKINYKFYTLLKRIV